MSTNNYQLYSASQLALDESFQQWVLHPARKNMFWENWEAENPGKAELIAQARHLVLGIQFRSYTLDTNEKEDLWETIWSGIGEEESYNTTVITSNFRWKRLATYAAALITGIILMAGWQKWKTGAEKPVLLSAHTKLGETRQLKLPDSSVVTLNADSKILYSQNSKGRREVWLDGEAFFNIKHTATNQTFTVHTYENLDVQVLGTQFNVNSIGKEIVVVLETGSILLNINEGKTNRKAELYLQPGEMIRYNKIDGSYAKKRVEVHQYTAWKTGKLIMDDFSMADAAAFMQQTFGKTLIVRDSQLLNYKVSGSMPIVYDPDTMMVQLSKVFRTRFNQRGDEIWIHK